MFCELLGKEEGYCRGKGGSMHIADQSHGNLGANAIVGGSMGIATGAALSAKTAWQGLTSPSASSATAPRRRGSGTRS
jgi:TPP-dependent pyruvate/acetoin dehydrogenase alpha subunit